MKLEDLDLLEVGHSIQLAGAVWMGKDQLFLCMFPEHQGRIYSMDLPGDYPQFSDDNNHDDFIVDTLDMGSEDWAKFIRQTDLLETEVLAQAENKKLVKAIIRKSQRQISQGVSWRVFKRDGYACRYCGNDDVPLTVDHLVLWEKGGPSIEENLVAADKRCNRTRGNLPYEVWLKHPYYLKVSQSLTAEQREANRELLKTLKVIPRRLHKSSR